MKQTVVLSITGRQNYPDQEPEVIELVTEGTTTATQCPYCGSPTILPDRIAGGIRPEMVVPFAITKEQAQKQFEEYFHIVE